MMEHNLKLFPTGNDLDKTPALKSHANDPATSHEAAAKHRSQATTNRERCVDAVYALYRADTGGPTAAEVAQWCGDFDSYEANRRLPEAEQVKKGAARICTIKQSKCVTWEPK